MFNRGDAAGAAAAQRTLAEVEWGFAKGGINGTKWVVAKYLDYPDDSWHCRRPYPKYGDLKQQNWISGVVEPLLALEKSLQGA